MEVHDFSCLRLTYCQRDAALLHHDSTGETLHLPVSTELWALSEEDEGWACVRNSEHEVWPCRAMVHMIVAGPHSHQYDVVDGAGSLYWDQDWHADHRRASVRLSVSTNTICCRHVCIQVFLEQVLGLVEF